MCEIVVHPLPNSTIVYIFILQPQQQKNATNTTNANWFSTAPEQGT